MNKDRKILEQLTEIEATQLENSDVLKQAAAEILRQNSRLEILHQLTRDINIEMSLQDIVEGTFNRLADALPCRFIGIIIPAADQLQLKAIAPQDERRTEDLLQKSAIWALIGSKVVPLLNGKRGASAHTCHNAEISDELTSFAVAPMHDRDRVIGALVVGRATDGPFSRSELDFTAQLSGQMAFSINNARLYKQVARSTREWEATFKAVGDSIVLIDCDYNILRHNDRLAAELANNWQQSVSNRCYERLYGQTEVCRDCPVAEIVQSGQTRQVRRQTANGLLLDVSFYPVLNDANQVTAVTLVLKDVTEQIRMEAKLVQTAKLAALGEMAAGVAHELNSPLTVIIGTAQLLARDADNVNEDQESLEDVINCGLRCKRIIQNLLTFSRQDRIAMREIDLNEEIGQALGLLRYQINSKQIQIIEDIDSTLPHVRANGAQIQQVITNLILNARDALDESDQELKQIKVHSEICQRDSERWIQISVADNAGGIDAESLNKIFSPFFTTKDASKGTGLGLSVSLGIAESHGGTIETESSIGTGSTFSLRLPLTQKGVGHANSH